MNFINEISRVKQLMGLIKESLSEGERVIWYNKCEGGIGKIDPNSFIFNGKQIDEKTKEERDVILFEKEPNLESVLFNI